MTASIDEQIARKRAAADKQAARAAALKKELRDLERKKAAAEPDFSRLKSSMFDLSCAKDMAGPALHPLGRSPETPQPSSVRGVAHVLRAIGASAERRDFAPPNHPSIYLRFGTRHTALLGGPS